MIIDKHGIEREKYVRGRDDDFPGPEKECVMIWSDEEYKYIPWTPFGKKVIRLRYVREEYLRVLNSE